MQKRKENHWVPQACLKQFAIDPTAEMDKRKIWRFRKSGGDPETKPIRKVAVKFYLYAPMGAHGRDYSTEERLGDLEQLFGLPYWRAIADGFVDLAAPATRKGLALLAAVMLLRNPARLHPIADLHTQLMTEFSNFETPPEAVQFCGRRIELDPTEWQDFRSGGEDFIKRIWLNQLNAAQEVARIFLEMRWSMHTTERPVFVTGDDPVIAIHEDLVFRGFRNPGTSVIFPLSPTRVLHLDWRSEQDDGKYYQSTGTYPAINFLIWRNSIDCMFSHRHPDVVCAEMISHADAQAE